MGITPQELRAIMKKAQQDDARPAQRGPVGFVASAKFSQTSRPLSEMTARQVRATFHLGKTFK